MQFLVNKLKFKYPEPHHEKDWKGWAGKLVFELHRQMLSDNHSWHYKKESLNFGSIGAGATAEQTVSMKGVRASDSVHITPPTGLEAGLIVCGIALLDNVKVRLGNITAAPIDPAVGDFVIDVWRVK
jgi:hypothetical protein